MWRLLGCARALTDADVWLLGKCYKLSSSSEEPSGDSDPESGGHAAFLEDFSSRVWVTYRKGRFIVCGKTCMLKLIMWYHLLTW
jgi:cysteine protease ATG4